VLGRISIEAPVEPSRSPIPVVLVIKKRTNKHKHISTTTNIICGLQAVDIIMQVTFLSPSFIFNLDLTSQITSIGSFHAKVFCNGK